MRLTWLLAVTVTYLAGELPSEQVAVHKGVDPFKQRQKVVAVVVKGLRFVVEASMAAWTAVGTEEFPKP
jgi:hypothetical protein